MAKTENTIEMSFLEHCVREELNKSSARVMAVLDPIKVVIENYSENKIEKMKAVNNPEDLAAGTRQVPFSRELYIERADFMEDPPKKFFRLSPGREVRLRYAYFITCKKVIKDENGAIVELRCTYDPATRGGDAPDGRRVKATLHWVSASQALDAEVRLYDHLFLAESPGANKNELGMKEFVNPDSLRVLAGCKVEPFLQKALPGERYQFERLGYFCVDADSGSEQLVFNRTVSLRDSWGKVSKR